MGKPICDKCGKEMIKKGLSPERTPALYADSTALSTITTSTSAAPTFFSHCSSSPITDKKVIKVATFICPDCKLEKQARDTDTE
jgi:predicted RNA-binding Zn-ribbon protein involved in translation (DUF1610 family)